MPRKGAQISEMTPATLLVKINRETVPESSIDLMMCSQVAAT